MLKEPGRACRVICPVVFHVGFNVLLKKTFYAVVLIFIDGHAQLAAVAVGLPCRFLFHRTTCRLASGTSGGFLGQKIQVLDPLVLQPPFGECVGVGVAPGTVAHAF